ncbi:hypothetical protein [Flavobacterium sp. HJJ]|uniref:hypothetical protein n=1 Tax=Flavobacterium sp. HJJ TaxID=2783792 RepID=UPI00188B0556|nr:hypothetical protein [Flavobacterium sp. HJJ]MBF4473838.1 hypothetical protein [Flavobacterium sp. HJJ]
MNKKTLLSIIFLIGLIHVYDNFFTKSMITGTYVSNGSGIDGPNKNDTLILLENNTYESQSWGKGEYTLKENTINIHYDYEFGKASYQMSIERNFYIKPKLVFDFDQDYYFEKIK